MTRSIQLHDVIRVAEDKTRARRYGMPSYNVGRLALVIFMYPTVPDPAYVGILIFPNVYTRAHKSIIYPAPPRIYGTATCSRSLDTRHRRMITHDWGRHGVAYQCEYCGSTGVSLGDDGTGIRWYYLRDN